MVEQQRCEYRNRVEACRVLVTEDSVILQTTAYTRFERFAERLESARQQGADQVRRLEKAGWSNAESCLRRQATITRRALKGVMLNAFRFASSADRASGLVAVGRDTAQ